MKILKKNYKQAKHKRILLDILLCMKYPYSHYKLYEYNLQIIICVLQL